MTRSATALAGLAVLALEAGCIPTKQEACRSDTDCYEAFGLGTTCNSDGFCSARQIDPRCAETFPEDLLAPERGAAYKDHVLIGSISPYEFDLFEQFALSARLAFKHVNDRGGLDGQRGFGLIMCDAKPASADGFDDGLTTSQQASAALARYLVDTWSVPAIFGPARSSEVEQAFLAVKDDGVLVISPSATSPDLRPLDVTAPADDNPGLLWRTAPPDDLQSQALAEDMIAPGPGRTAPVTTVAAIFLNDAYGTALYSAFAASFETGGGRDAQAFPYAASAEGQTLPEVVATVGTMGSFDEILFVTSTPSEFVDFLDIIADSPAFDGKGIFLSEAAASAEVLGGADPTRFPQVRGSRPRPLDRATDTVYEQFLAEYLVEYDVGIADQIFTPNSYDAGWMIAAGAAWAHFQEGGEITGTNIAKGLRKLSAGPAVVISPGGWPTLRSNFQQGTSVNLNGASGPVDFDPTTEETESPIQIWTIDANKAPQEVDVRFPPQQ